MFSAEIEKELFRPFDIRSIIDLVLESLGEEKKEEKEEKKESVTQENVNKVPSTNVTTTLEIPFPGAPQDSEYYIMNIAKTLNISKEVAIYTLSAIHKLTPGALLNILLQEVAKELDLNYANHISESTEIYTFSPLDAKIYKHDPAKIKKVAYKYFAAFRTHEDAIFGIKMANQIKNYIFNYCDKQKG